jgi:hypothetical protein
MKEFFSLFHLKELRILLSIEVIIILLIWSIASNQDLSIKFCYEAAFASFVCWLIASVVNPKGYFNFFTLLGVGIFGYGVFWFLFEILVPLLLKYLLT